VIELPLGVGELGSHPGDWELPNATFVATSAGTTGCENVMVNLTAAPVKQPGLVLVAVALVTGPSVAVIPDPRLTVRLPGLGDDDCTGFAGTVCNFVGPGGGADTVAPGAVAEAVAGVGLTAGFVVELEPVDALAVAEVAAAETNALAAAGSAGVEAATAGDDTGALGNVLDAAAAAGPDDAALLIWDELEHPERASAATTVTPINPVRRARSVMAFPPAGMGQQ
jgi:hypothetical protein